MTLAFAACDARPWLHLPARTSCLLEAQTPLRCDLQPCGPDPATLTLP